MLLEKPAASSTVTTTNVSTTEPITDLSGTVTVAIIADPIVNNAITTTATSASPAQAATATVPLAPTPAAPAAPEPKKEEVAAKTSDSSTAGSGQSGGTKPSDSPKSNREALAERRRDAAQKEAVAKGGNLANEMGKASDLEAQKAVQNVVIAAMGFTPGFDNYNKAMIPDTNFYKPYSVYGNQKTVDNQQVSRRLMGGSDRVHQEMVESQYKLGDK
jgi:hypothetical protein